MIVFAETPGQAKSRSLGTYGDDYVNLRAYRERAFDRWESVHDIPAWFLVNSGWWFECHHCGETIEESSLLDEGKDPTKVIGEYTSAVYCCQECKDDESLVNNQKMHMILTLRDHFEKRIRLKFGHDIVFRKEPHIYIDDGLRIRSLEFYGQIPSDPSIDFDCKMKFFPSKSNTNEDSMPLAQAIETKLHTYTTAKDREAFGKFIYEKEGIDIDADKLNA